MIKLSLMIWLFLNSTFLFAQTREGIAVRKFLHDCVAASVAPKGQQSLALQNVFINNVEGINALLLRQDHTTLLAEAGIDRYGVIRKEHLAITELGQQILSRFQIRKSHDEVLDAQSIRALSKAVIREPLAEQFLNILRTRINAVKFSEQQVLTELFHSERGIQMRDPNLEHLIREELPKYYDNMKLEEKTRIVTGILELPVKADHFDHLDVMLQETGPLVQKLFQLLKDNVSNPRLAEIFAKVQSQVKPFPFEQIKPIIERNFGPLEQAFKSFNTKPLASGTIGQVHIAVLHSGEEVIVKVRRPEVMKRLESDRLNLREVIQDSGISELVGKMHGTILTETDFRREAEFLKQGEIYIDKAKGITIARLHNSFKPTEEVLVIEKAKGQPMSELQSESLQSLYMKGDALVKLADLWFRKAVYDTGFFHGDLHGGNLFFKADVDSRVGYLLTVIDFGNAHTLSLDQQRGFVKLGVSSLLGTEFAAAHAIREMLQLNENETPKIESLVNSSFEKATSVSERLTITIIELEQSGYKLPEAFVSFARARLFIDEALFKINEEIKNKGGKKKFNSLNTLAWSTIKQMFSHLPWNQKVLSFYFFKNLAFENCKNLKDKLSLQVPRLLQPKAR